MACGTPVAATNVSGTPEVVTAPEAGLLIPERTADCIAETIIRLFAELPLRSQTRAYAETFSWDSTTEGQLKLFRAVLKESSARI
jgi:glycosyltransferase involved in cell wall biosynthesis